LFYWLDTPAEKTPLLQDFLPVFQDYPAFAEAFCAKVSQYPELDIDHVDDLQSQFHASLVGMLPLFNRFATLVASPQ